MGWSTRNTWPGPRTSRAARARSTSSCWPRSCAWSTCRATASRGCRGPWPRSSRTWAAPICGAARTLKRVYLLIDARHGLKKVDAEALDALDTAAVSYQIILTKSDKIKPARGREGHVKSPPREGHRQAPRRLPPVLATSSEKGEGMPELRAEIARVCLDE
jgi:hypothetical protein